MQLINMTLSAFGEAEMMQPGIPAAEHTAKRSFDELVKNEYKKEFSERVQAILDRRFKTVNAELSAVRPIMALLRQRYGVKDGAGAAEAVRRALEHDEAFWGAAAEPTGMQPAQYRRLLQAEADSQELRTRLAAQQTAQRRREELDRLNREAEQVKERYPDFDLRAELEGTANFGALIQRGIDMLTAYQVCHQDEILEQAAQDAESRTMSRVRANRSRPVENGRGGSRAVRLSSDPSKWTKEQVRDVSRRVSRGERIVL